MKKLAGLFVLCGLIAANAQVNAAEMSDAELASQLGKFCLSKAMNMRKFNEAIAEGATEEEAVKKAAVVKAFNSKKFNEAVAKGESEDSAAAKWTVYEYAEESSFCIQYRMIIKNMRSNPDFLK